MFNLFFEWSFDPFCDSRPSFFLIVSTGLFHGSRPVGPHALPSAAAVQSVLIAQLCSLNKFEVIERYFFFMKSKPTFRDAFGNLCTNKNA